MLIVVLAVIVTVLVWALIQTCLDLWERGPYEAPLMNDDGRERSTQDQSGTEDTISGRPPGHDARQSERGIVTTSPG